MFDFSGYNYSVDSFDFVANKPEESFKRNKILAQIASKIGRRHDEIVRKSQLRYILLYLSSKHMGAKTVVFENQYIDRNYLEDYAEYYSRCYSSYDRFCSRVHFFSNEFGEEEFSELIEKGRRTVAKGKLSEEKLNKNYLGYFVVRPVPKYFIGKSCLRHYKYLKTSRNYKVIANTNNVNLFGMCLSVETTPLCEQDNVVAACATSALWTALNGHKNLTPFYMPSLSKITKTALFDEKGKQRVFPATSLKPSNLGAVYKKYGLEPFFSNLKSEENSNFEDFMENIRDFKILLNSFIESSIPIIVGGKIYTEIEGKTEEVGDHLITALGYSDSHRSLKIKKNSTFRARLVANSIDKCFVHDDRLGQYVRFDLKNNKKITVGGREFHCLMINNYDKKVEYFEPQFFMLGTYHKIRLNIWDFAKVAESVHYHIQYLAMEVENDKIEISNLNSTQEESLLKSTVIELRKLSWEIKIIDSSEYKRSLRTQNDFYHSTISDTLSELCSTNMPKYIWLLRAKVGEKKYFDIIYDSTEIPHGDLALGTICFNENAQRFINFYRHLPQDNNIFVELQSSLGIIGRIDFRNLFGSWDGESNFLDNNYGKARPPRRNLKNGELGKADIVTESKKVILIEGGVVQFQNPLLTSVKYIWLVDKDGRFIVGIDKETNNPETGIKEFEGHTTLCNYGLARVGGELKWNEDKKVWIINSISGAYSRHLNTKDKQREVLTNVKENYFSKLETIGSVEIA